MSDPADLSATHVVSVIVPTYREVENLPLIVPRITEALREAGIEHEILVVDDNSPDGTPEACRALADAGHAVRLLVRTEERGLSTAVVHGMEHAKGDVLVCMDADGSHPPTAIPAMVAAVTSDADFSIGSRYVEGGTTDEDWGVFRWLNSKVATLLARPLTAAKDPMAGFFALKADTYRAADQLSPVGYKIGLELITKCGCRNIAEVPIHFADRVEGESKLNFKEQLNYLRHLKRLYEYRLGRAAKPMMFAAVGASGMVIDLALLTLLVQAMPFAAARAIAIAVAMTWNFWLNRRVTFSYARKGHVGYQYLMFVLSCLGGAIVNWGVSVAMVTAFPGLEPYPWAAGAVGVVAGAVVNYFLAARLAFAKKS